MTARLLVWGSEADNENLLDDKLQHWDVTGGTTELKINTIAVHQTF